MIKSTDKQYEVMFGKGTFIEDIHEIMKFLTPPPPSSSMDVLYERHEVRDKHRKVLAKEVAEARQDEERFVRVEKRAAVDLELPIYVDSDACSRKKPREEEKKAKRTRLTTAECQTDAVTEICACSHQKILKLSLI